MGRIFIWTGQSGTVDYIVDREILVRIQNEIARELKFRSFSVLDVPPELNLPETIDWINLRAQTGDVALALETDTFSNSNVRGTRVLYIANNLERRTQAEQLLEPLLLHEPLLINRGAQPDTATETGRLAFTRQIKIPALVLRVGFVTNLTDKSLMTARGCAIAQGIMNGLIRWSRSLAERGIGLPYPPIDISINGQAYGECGILVEGNAYVPIDIIDQFNIDINCPMTVRLLDYGGITYIRTIDLREANVLVGWDADTRTVILRTLLPFKPEDMGKILGSGYFQQSDYEAFLDQINPEALQRFPDIAQLYQEEATIEGVNPDVAFAQALLEVNFFGFNAFIKPTQNNFGGLGSTTASREFASFPNARIGVRAHIQHLKAYANEEPLVQEVVDPRFSFVPRGVAPQVEQLSRRWSADANYGENILAILRRLYESAGLL